MSDIAPLALSDMVTMSGALRNAGAGASCMEDVATAVVDYLRRTLTDPDTGERVCALARFYKSHRYDDLPADLHGAATEVGAGPGDNCLTLLATRGSVPAWNDRRQSVAHRALPLHSTAAIARLPMVSALVNQLGIEPELLADPQPSLFTELDERSYNVFYVGEALASPFVPDQDGFVVPHGIRSALGFGGVLPSGDLFAVVLFTTVPVPRETAERFSSLALSIKLAILPFVDGPVFAEPAATYLAGAELDDRQLRSRSAALAQLLDVRERSIREQATRLESALAAAEERAREVAASQAALLASEARNRAIVRSSIDAIVSIDHDGRVIEFNPAAERMFGCTRDEACGRPVHEVIIPPRLRARHLQGMATFRETGEGPILGRHIEIVAQRVDGSEFPVELTVTSVALEDAPPIFTAFVRDISAHKESERARVAAQRHTADIARTLQDSLLPPLLPQIPGTEIAARYVPAAGGSQIGGDFYDVFETGRNDWAVVLGDVCGKGAEAATVTALARYTTRAAAIRARRPSKVLAVLNDAVLSQYPERFLTAAYVRLQHLGGVHRAVTSLGGHPHPLVLSPDGAIARVGESSFMVGAFADAAFTDSSFELPSKHALVLFTDGVTEARRGRDFFGDDRLHSVLADVGGESAPDIVDAVVHAVRDFEGAEPSDDLAILVIRAD